MDKPAILLIGGIDPQGCSGIMTDSQAVSNHGCLPIPLITCLTEQTKAGPSDLGVISADQFMRQYQSIVANIDIAAIKVGLIPNLEIAQAVHTILTQHPVPIIFDPVLATTSDGICISHDVQTYLFEQLLPCISLLTPNIIELQQLTQETDKTLATNSLQRAGLKACLVKGGHANSPWATDYFYNSDHSFYCYTEKQPKFVRGTGCVLAASIASNMALNHDIRDAIVLAKAYVTRGIRQAKNVGPHHVINHADTAFTLDDIPKLCYQSASIGQSFHFPPCPQRLGIYPIVDHIDWVKKLIDVGINTIQLRIKDASPQQKHTAIKQAKAHCHHQTAFFVNDDWQAAIEHQVYGVHLGQEDLHQANLSQIAQAGLRLGVSTHSYWELARALAVNPSYIAFGPVFKTSSKVMPWAPQGIARVKQWQTLLNAQYPLVAIGGINLQRAKQLHATGVGSVAMIFSITKTKDYKAVVRDLIAMW